MTFLDIISALIAAYIAGFLGGGTLGVFSRILGGFLH